MVGFFFFPKALKMVGVASFLKTERWLLQVYRLTLHYMKFQNWV